MKIIESIDLYFQSGGSDKVYHVAIFDLGGPSGIYEVRFKYGRRGTPSNGGTKVATPDFSKAKDAYDKLVDAKTSGKGGKDKYWVSNGISGNIWGSVPSGNPSPPAATQPTPPAPVQLDPKTTPMLLNAATQVQADELIDSPAWFAQEKKDGYRMIAQGKTEQFQTAGAGVIDGREFYGFNKKGKSVEVPNDVVKALAALDVDLVIDGEMVNGVYYVFDLLEARGVDFRSRSRMYAYKTLETMLEGKTGKHLQLVKAYFTPEEKRDLVARLKAEKREGFVLKRCNSAYKPGRPNSGGDALKFKFTETASVFVMGRNGDKSSVKVGVYRDNGNRQPADDFEVYMGCVTIPPNKEIPTRDTVVEVQYLYVQQEGGCLYQPVYLGVRDDVEKDECLHTQMKIKPKDEDDDDVADAA